MEAFENILVAIDDFVWGVPLIVLILAAGIFLTCRVKLLQVFHLPKALKFMFQNEKDGVGEVSSFGALCTALSATIGTGNIVGVATAIVAGGPGALFWMIVAAFFGMATKYAEGLLAVKYRTVDENGKALGGPFYYIEKGMGKAWKWLACLFAFFGMCVGLFGIGTFTQVQGVTNAVKSFFDPEGQNIAFSLLGNDYSWAVVIAGVIIGLCAALVIIGGIKRIAKVSEVIVPFMAVLYIAVCLFIVCFNITKVPSAVVEVIQSAFGFRAVAGGALGAILVAMQKGIARGIFSNEAGLGSAPIAAAAAKTHEPVRQGLVTMTGTFIDTIIVCSLTGITIVLTGAWNVGKDGVDVTMHAFNEGLPFLDESVTSFMLMICLVFFAFTTILGWDYYSEKCLEYLTGSKKWATMIFRWAYIACVFIGPYMTLKSVWTIADIFNGLMAVPNIIALLALSGVVAKETKSYFDRQKPGAVLNAKK